MQMVVYHGSDANFKNLRISKSLVKHESTMNNEGLGIYFSTDPRVAQSYGKYVYTLEVNSAYFMDFRKRVVCTQYLTKIGQEIFTKYKVNIFHYFSLSDFVGRMFSGGQAIYSVGHDIAEILDNTYEFFQEVPESKRQRIYGTLRKVDKNNRRVYMFNYHIKNIGVIKSVDPDIVKIVDKRRSFQ